ncbi:MAG: DUF4234 domain-containing protein [Deltaproteobacteria bacterium]|nr:DUF4234 domain-containing protein [Deltaproteobacteria bacterium]
MNSDNTTSSIDNPYSIGESALSVGASPPIDEDENQAHIAFSRMSVALLLVLSVVTLGIYIPLWYMSRLEQLNRIKFVDKLNSTPFIIILVLYSISAAITIISIVMDFSVSTMQGIDGIDRVINIVGGITILVQSFKIKRMLERYTGQPYSGPGTFFFQYLYLQHKMNSARPMEEDIE